MLGRGRKKIELPIEEIVKKWEQGVTQKELSKEYGVSEALIGIPALEIGWSALLSWMEYRRANLLCWRKH